MMPYGKLKVTIHATGIFLYLLKTSENLQFSDTFRGYRKRPVLNLVKLKEFLLT